MGNKFDWVVHSTTATNIDSGAGDSYDLVNVTITKCLRYGEREYGINLLWDEPGRTSPNIGFERNGAAQAIQYGELIAIHVRGGGYLRYKEREYGINLVWAEDPIYEWRIEGDSGASGQVPTETPVALFNTTHNDYLFYDPRRYGIDLKWLKDEGKYNDSPWYEDAGDFFEDAWSLVGNGLKELFNRLIGLPDFVLTFFGIMLPKKMYVQVRILRDEVGRAVLADEGSSTDEQEADRGQIQRAIDHFKDVLDSQVNTEMVAVGDDEVVTLDVASPTAALDVACGFDAIGEDQGEAGDFFRRHLAKRGTSWALGYGAPVTVFVVRNVEGKRGCSLGPITDYITVDVSGFEDDPDGADDVDPGKPPSTLAHEVGHACGLWHPVELLEKPLGNLMLASRRGRGKILDLRQRAIFRNSRHVTFF
jgi:hypothetical protein